MQELNIKKSLFLDRDGVINRENAGDYIKSVKEFEFLPGVLEALQIAKQHFDYIFIVTNQRGIGRELMTEADLHAIHEHMQLALREVGVSIDKIYFAPSPDKKHPYRKPNIGMATHAKEDFPDIDFENALMIGNNISDMVFGRMAGMKTVFLHTTQPPQEMPHEWINEQYESLLSWAKTL